MGNSGLFVQITQATIDLITNHMDVFVATGDHMFRVFATILVIWEGFQFALAGSFHANRFAALVLSWEMRLRQSACALRQADLAGGSTLTTASSLRKPT